jgi:transposase
VELMWLLGRLYPDHKSIAEFRRLHRDAVSASGAKLVQFAKSCGLVRGEWIAIDGSKFRAVSSIDTARERFQAATVPRQHGKSGSGADSHNRSFRS